MQSPPSEPLSDEESRDAIGVSLATVAKQRIGRKDSIVPTMGSEGQLIRPAAYLGTSITVFTSGGDSQGKTIVVR
jgi:hypothetical protein